MKHINDEWRNRSVPELLSLQTGKMVVMIQNVEKAILAMLDGDFEAMREPAVTATYLEKECDSIKEALADKLYDEKGATQFTKADRHKIVVKVDSVINMADLIAHKLLLKDLIVPPTLVPAIKDLVKYTMGSVRELSATVDDLRRDFKKAIKDATIVEDDRREARKICWDLLKELYHIQTDPLTMILTRELIMDVTWLADQAESFSDFIETIALKYSRIK